MTHSTPTASSAGRVYLTLEFGHSLVWTLSATLYLVFQVQVAQLSALQLVLAGTALELAILVAEVPTGVVADLTSRKRSVVIGHVVMGVGLGMGVIWPSFWPIMLGSAVWGVGWTFISGAKQAWLVDEVGVEHAQPLLTRAHQVGLVAAVLGIVASAVLGWVDVRVPLLVGAGGFVLLGLWLQVAMPEDGFTPTPSGERETWQHLRRTAVAGLSVMRRSPVVRTMALVFVLSGLASEVFDRLWTPHVLSFGALPSWGLLRGAEVWFSVFALVGLVIGLVASLAANRWGSHWMQHARPAGLLALLLGLEIVGVVGVASSGGAGGSALWWALGFLWLNGAAQSVAGPVRDTWLHRELDSSTRATSLSFLGQADAVGQLVGGPVLGSVANRWSIPVALVVASIVKAPAVPMLAALGRDRDPHGPGSAPILEP